VLFWGSNVPVEIFGTRRHQIFEGRSAQILETGPRKDRPTSSIGRPNRVGATRHAGGLFDPPSFKYRAFQTFRQRFRFAEHLALARGRYCSKRCEVVVSNARVNPF
jgi:hypothetical protein